MEFNTWLDECLPKHRRLTESVVSIMKSLVEASNIDYLSITGRTKDVPSINKKINKKRYKDPKNQLTDISGIRIIVFIESDIEIISNIISNSFTVDLKNSSNKDDGLSSNQVGYRSVHFVCDLGIQRAELPEFSGLSSLKFEFQIRTVLQHAWAELAHDRSYKFDAELPKEIQRSLYLHAGLLEIADKGFSEIAKEIDAYSNKVIEEYKTGNLDVEINSISIKEFIEEWAEKNNYPLEEAVNNSMMGDLIKELKYFNITKISELNSIIPKNYVEESNNLNIKTNIYGLVRDWMIIKDVYRIKRETGVNWTLFDPDSDFNEMELYKKLSDEENYKKINLIAREENDYLDGNEEYNTDSD
jgi:putative GTP pyrophosphokinase